MRTALAYGAETIEVELPETTVTPDTGISVPLPRCDDLGAEYERALREPLDSPPLAELAKPGAKVTIAFDDATVGQYAPSGRPLSRSSSPSSRARACRVTTSD